MHRRVFLKNIAKFLGYGPLAYAALSRYGATHAEAMQLNAGKTESTGCSGTIGNTAETDSDSRFGTAHRVYVKSITPDCSDSDGWTLYVRVSGFNDTDRNGTFVLYSDSGGAPNTLSESHSFTQDGSGTAHWISQGFTTAITASTPVHVGMAVQYQTSQIYISSSTGGTENYGVASDYSSPGDWSGLTSTGSSARNLEIYIDYN